MAKNRKGEVDNGTPAADANGVAAASGGTAVAETPTPTKRVRNPRGNHAAAEIVISDVETAQAYVSQVRMATKDEPVQQLYNSSGFVSPSNLDDEDVDNLLRMNLCIIAALANISSSGGTNATAATAAMGVITDYIPAASRLQRLASRRATLIAAARTLNEDFQGTDDDLLETYLSNQGTSWAAIEAKIS